MQRRCALKDTDTQCFASDLVNSLNDLILNKNTRQVNNVTSTSLLFNEEHISKAKNDVGNANINVESRSLWVKHLKADSQVG